MKSVDISKHSLHIAPSVSSPGVGISDLLEYESQKYPTHVLYSQLALIMGH